MEGLRPSCAVKAIIVIVVSSVWFRCVDCAPTNHSVGGPTGWNLASDLHTWAASTTFHAGDNLVFSYWPTHDVLEVNQADYATCRTVNPISVHSDGKTVIQLQEGGTTRFFICGRRRHCAMGLKLEVHVLSDSDQAVSSSSPSPAPSLPNPADAPAGSGGEGSMGGRRRGGGSLGRRSPPPLPPPPPPASSGKSPPAGGHDHAPAPQVPAVDNEKSAPAPDSCHCSGVASDHTKLGSAIWAVDAGGFFLSCFLALISQHYL
ncbi:blue copper protein 1b-like [Diospyros lotus]|uniref:blue copper protein 1b-like n=1 Tax=Diospyros lotus TaxID=55363 RepID=UPI0022571BD8|nr:blue copper protein 1b-like [Diospyros lotus]